MKAQVTIFIIIGLVLLIAVGITLYVTSFIVTKPKIVKKNVKEFVVDCLKQAGEDSFKEIGLNGGYFENDVRQIITKEDQKFSLLVTKPYRNICSGAVCLYYFQPWKYPWPLFPYKSESKQEKVFTGYFGDSALLPLPVIKSKLEADIKQKLLKCADFSILARQGVDVQANAQPKVSITFYNLTYLAEEQISQDRLTIVNLDWPLVESTGVSVAKEKLFTVKLPLRFATMYYSVESIINNDISNISYVPDIKGLNIKVTNFEDFSLVNVSDPLSQILGEKFNFVFARQNRNPALWWVDLPVNEFFVVIDDNGFMSPVEIRIDQNNKLLSFIDRCQGTATVKINASDADEDNLFFKTVPEKLTVGDEKFRLIVNDGSTEDYDYQDIGVNVGICT